MNILVDIILDSGTLLKSLQDFYYIENRVSEDNRKRISEDGKYRIAGGDFYIGDIIDDFQITETFPDIFYGVQQTDPVILLLANGNNDIDDTWDEIIAAEEIRGKRVLIRREDLSIVASGKITDYIIGDETSLSIELRDDEIFDTLLPQQLVTAAEFTTTALDIGTLVPILLGYCKNVPLANIQNNLVDDHYDYLIGYGTVESLWIDHDNNKGVKRNGVLVAESEYTFYDGSQASPYPGYSFIRFVKEQMDFSGGFYMLSADVKGLELSGASADRNFANVIKALIENTTWGLSDSVNSASFVAAAAALSTTYWMCDGAITKQVKARDVLDQLLFSACSSLKRNSDGEWEIIVDGTRSSIVSFGENDGYYDNCEIESVGITPSSSVIKKAIIHYDLNELPFTAVSSESMYRVSSFGQKEIALDVNTGFGVDQTFELPFVIENTTAEKILSYIYGRAKYADKKVTFKADSDAKNLYCGNVITITSTPRNLSSVDYKVISISKRLTEYILECEKYDSRIFDDQSITDPEVWSGSPSAHGLQVIKFGTVGGWAVDENTLAKGSKIVLDATNEKIYINNETFGNQGIQLEYNSGNPRVYIGDGSDVYWKFDGSHLTISVDANVGTGVGIVYKDGKRWLYDFNPAHNGTVQPNGFNTFLGIECGNLTIGSTATIVNQASYNTGIGYRVLYANTTGYGNAGIGYRVLYANTEGYKNVGIGYRTLYSNSTGYNNIGIGYEALYSATGGHNHVGIGYQALYSVTGGKRTVGIAINAGRYQNDGMTALATPEDSIYIGSLVKSGSSPEGGEDNIINEIVIGHAATGNGANTITLGNTSIAEFHCQVALTVDSDKRIKRNIIPNIEGLNFINALNPITFQRINPFDYPDEIKPAEYKNRIIEGEVIKAEKRPPDNNKTYLGLIAQEVEKVIAAQGIDLQLIVTSNKGKKAITYGNLIMPLITAVQELSHKVKILEAK